MISGRNKAFPYVDIPFPTKLVSRIIFGMETSIDDISRIIEAVRNKYTHIKFEQVFYDSEDQKLKSKSIQPE